MSDQLLTALKFALLAVLYLFFLRVLRAVWAELKEPKAGPAAGADAAATVVRPAPGVWPVPAPPPHPKPAPPGEEASPPQPAGERLVVVDPPGARGRAFPLDGQEGEFTVGRAAGCGVALPEDTFVSQVHARVFRTDQGWHVEDLGSTNGTFLNQRRISGPQPIHTGDRIQVGRTVFEVTG